MRLMYEFLPDHFGIMLREQPQNRIGLLFAIKVACTKNKLALLSISISLSLITYFEAILEFISDVIVFCSLITLFNQS